MNDDHLFDTSISKIWHFPEIVNYYRRYDDFNKDYEKFKYTNNTNTNFMLPDNQEFQKIPSITENNILTNYNENKPKNTKKKIKLNNIENLLFTLTHKEKHKQNTLTNHNNISKSLQTITSPNTLNNCFITRSKYSFINQKKNTLFPQYNNKLINNKNKLLPLYKSNNNSNSNKKINDSIKQKRSLSILFKKEFNTINKENNILKKTIEENQFSRNRILINYRFNLYLKKFGKTQSQEKKNNDLDIFKTLNNDKETLTDRNVDIFGFITNLKNSDDKDFKEFNDDNNKGNENDKGLYGRKIDFLRNGHKNIISRMIKEKKQRNIVKKLLFENYSISLNIKNSKP